MPYVLKPNKLFAKDPNGEGYLPQNVITDQATADMVDEIEEAGAEQVAAIEAKGEEVIESIPSDYTELSDEVGELTEDVADLQTITEHMPPYSIRAFGDYSTSVGEYSISYSGKFKLVDAHGKEIARMNESMSFALPFPSTSSGRPICRICWDTNETTIPIKIVENMNDHSPNLYDIGYYNSDKDYFLGIVSDASIKAKDSVRYNTAQNLTSAQKAQARTNIGAADAEVVGTLQTTVGNTPMGTEATTITGAIKEHGDNLGDLKSAVETNYARNDGSYANMTVGNAEQLVATVGVEDSTPYNFRTAGGTADIGDRLVEKVVGGTVAWNQLARPISNTYWLSDRTVTFNSGKATVHRDSSVGGTALMYLDLSSRPKVIPDHKYLFMASVQTTNGVLSLIPTGTSSEGQLNYLSYTTKTCIGMLWKLPVSYINAILRIEFRGYTGGASVESAIDYTVEDVVCFDLTQMFGSTIADYIYNLEQATAGAGVAWFKHLFPKDYYEYNAGELMSVQAASHKTVGFNLFDKSQIEDGYVNDTTGEIRGTSTSKNTGYVRVIGGMKYHIRTDATNGKWGAWYDDGKNYISGMTPATSTGDNVIAPQDAAYMRMTVVYNNNNGNPDTFCINLSWDGERDGEYEPYAEHVYPLDDSLTLRGIPKLDSNNNLYYDGDVYESDGTVTRRYGVVDLGTLTWILYETDGKRTFNTNSITIPARSVAVMSKEYTYKTAAYISMQEEKTFETFGAPELSICDTSFTGNAAAFKTAMSGVYLVYELATPTTETADPYQNPQIVDDFGTEEYTDAGVIAETRDVAIPVGHESVYQANLRAKLEMSPDSPDGDGDYIVRQTNGQNEYVPLIIPTELPQNPSENGTYVLKATVNNGTMTLSWEAQS